MQDSHCVRNVREETSNRRLRFDHHRTAQEMCDVRREKTCDLNLELQDSNKKEKKNEKNSCQSSKIIHREEIEDESLDDHNRKKNK